MTSRHATAAMPSAMPLVIGRRDDAAATKRPRTRFGASVMPSRALPVPNPARIALSPLGHTDSAQASSVTANRPPRRNPHSTRGTLSAHLSRVPSLEAFGRRPRCLRPVAMGRHPKPFTKAAVSKRNKVSEQKVWKSLSPDQPV